MESDFDARGALDAVKVDRRRVAERMIRETWWAAPAQGIAAALLVSAPAAGIQGMAIVFGSSALLFLGVEYLFRRRTGLTITRPAGPLGMTLLVSLGVLLGGSVVTAVMLSIFGGAGWITPLAAVCGVVTAIGVAAYDRVYAREVCLAR